MLILIAIVYKFSKRWRLEANVKKSSKVLFQKRGGFRFLVPICMQGGEWVCGDDSLPALDSYCYLGMDYMDGLCDKHMKLLIMRNGQNLQVHCRWFV